MVHSQQSSIDILRTRTDSIEEAIEAEKQGLNRASELEILQAILINMAQASEEIKCLPQEPTTDDLLEEMPPPYIVLGSDDFGWFAEIGGNNNMVSGKTPREALLALKEKLSSNK